MNGTSWFKRIGLFVLTNVLIMVTVGVVWSVLSAFLNLNGINGYIPSLMLLSLVMGMSGSFISLWLSKWMAKTMYGVQVIDPMTTNSELRNLVEMVHRMSENAGLPKLPEVGIYESDDINAFATGPSKSNALVAVSTGLLRKMDTQEVAGVLGHEVTHIANGDMVTMTLIQGIVNAFAFFFSRILANLIASNVEEKYRTIVRWVCVIVGDILFTLLGSIVVCYFSRRREFRADEGGARLASKSNMILALQKLQMATARNDEDRPNEQDQLATLKISSEKPQGLMALLMTHPPLEERIAALRKLSLQ